MNTTDFTSVFKEALLSTPKTSSSMQPEDFLGHLFTTDKQIAAKTYVEDEPSQTSKTLASVEDNSH